MHTGCTREINGCSPEHNPTVNVSNVTYTGLGSNVVDVFVTDRGSVGDPAAGGNSVTARQSPVARAPFVVFLGGLRLNLTLDYTVNSGTVTFNTITLNTQNVVTLDYWTASA